MILAWLGRPTEEEALCASWTGSRRGYSLGDAATELGGACMTLDAELPASYAWLRARLDEPCWIIAQMFAAPLARITTAIARPPVPSRFGSLTNAALGSLHAVVLGGAEPRGFSYLDPYYPRDGQPRVLSNEQFAEAWQGAVVLVSK
jgi:hypothetical protein